jgi:hypothetical protein
MRNLLVIWVVLTVLALVGWDLVPEQAVLVLDAYLLASAALAMWALIRTLTADYPTWGWTEFDRTFETRAIPSARPEELEHVERSAAFGRSNALDAHARLKPLLREIADAHLAARYGRGLDTEPAAVRARLGDQAWEVIRQQPEPVERHGPGMDLRELDAVVDALEELARR